MREDAIAGRLRARYPADRWVLVRHAATTTGARGKGTRIGDSGLSWTLCALAASSYARNEPGVGEKISAILQRQRRLTAAFEPR